MNNDTQKRPFTFAFMLMPKFNSLALSALVEPLRIANYCNGHTIYEWQFLSVDGTAVPASTEMTVATQPTLATQAEFDAIIICGGWNTERYSDNNLFRWLRASSRRGIILGAVDTGAHILANAGLLSGYSATVHWHCHDAFEERYPDINLKDQLFVIDRKRMTCAGGTACLDMMLQEIKQRHGKALATEVSDQLICAPERDEHEPQKKVKASQQTSIHCNLQRAISIMEKNTELPVSIPELTQQLNLSQRKLERLFNKQFNCSAVAFYRGVRLQKARTLLTQTNMSVLDICIACGFSSSSYFSKAYHDQFGIRPRDHRTAWPDSETDVFWPGVAAAMATVNTGVQPN